MGRTCVRPALIHARVGATNGVGFGATFQVFVVLDTDNEAGSNKVTIIVPPGGGGP